MDLFHVIVSIDQRTSLNLSNQSWSLSRADKDINPPEFGTDGLRIQVANLIRFYLNTLYLSQIKCTSDVTKTQLLKTRHQVFPVFLDMVGVYILF